MFSNADDGDDNGDHLERLEKSILQWKPKAEDEALAVLEVLQANLTVGQRSDGADQRAVRNLMRFIREAGKRSVRGGKVSHDGAAFFSAA